MNRLMETNWQQEEDLDKKILSSAKPNNLKQALVRKEASEAKLCADKQ